jgi:hypothetical protein
LWRNNLATALVVSKVRLPSLDRREPRLGALSIDPMVVELPVAHILVVVAAAAHYCVVLLYWSLQASQELAALRLVLWQLARRVAVDVQPGELRAIRPATHARMVQWSLARLRELSWVQIRQPRWARDIVILTLPPSA